MIHVQAISHKFNFKTAKIHFFLCRIKSYNLLVIRQQGHSVHNNTEHFLWSQVGKWAIMGQKLIYYHIGTPTYMLNDVSKHPRPLKIMLNHIFKNQCHKPRNKKKHIFGLKSRLK